MEISRPESKQPIPPHAKKVFEGVIFDVYQWEQELFDGKKTTFEKLKRRDSVAIFPVTPDGKIVITEDIHPGRAAVITAPGGQRDDGETLEETAARELLEETGYRAEKIEFWYAFQPETKIEWSIFIFIGRNTVKVADAHTDGGEKIKVMLVTFDELLELSQKQNFQNEEFASLVLRAKQDSGKMEELRKLFFQ